MMECGEISEKRDVRNYMQYVLIFLPAIIAGIIQSTTGFGSGTFMMLFLPMLLPMLRATALSAFISAWLNLALALRYRKHLDPKLFLPPVIPYWICSYFAIQVARSMDVTRLKMIFGLFLIVIAIYFIFFDKKIKVNGGILSALICGGLSGVLSGLFGIGGPPMVIYFLAVTHDDKNSYIANSQGFFTLAISYSCVVRALSGILTVDLLPLAIPGLAGLLLGKNIGVRILDRLPIATIKKLVYLFLAFSGAVTFLSTL